MPITLKVRDVMDKNVVVTDVNTVVSEVLKAMLQNNVWSVVVLEKGLPAGVVTDRDVLRRCVGKGMSLDRIRAREIMSSPLIQIDKDASIGEAMGKMVENAVRRLYIVESGKVVGRITQTGVLESALNLMLTLSSATL